MLPSDGIVYLGTPYVVSGNSDGIIYQGVPFVSTITTPAVVNIVEAYSDVLITNIGFEQVLNYVSPETTFGIYQVFIDCNNMSSNDSIIIQIKESISTGGISRAIIYDTLYGIQQTPIWVSPYIILCKGWNVTINHYSGLSNSFPYSIRQVSSNINDLSRFIVDESASYIVDENGNFIVS